MPEINLGPWSFLLFVMFYGRHIVVRLGSQLAEKETEASSSNAVN